MGQNNRDSSAGDVAGEMTWRLFFECHEDARMTEVSCINYMWALSISRTPFTHQEKVRRTTEVSALVLLTSVVTPVAYQVCAVSRAKVLEDFLQEASSRSTAKPQTLVGVATKRMVKRSPRALLVCAHRLTTVQKNRHFGSASGGHRVSGRCPSGSLLMRSQCALGRSVPSGVTPA